MNKRIAALNWRLLLNAPGEAGSALAPEPAPATGEPAVPAEGEKPAEPPAPAGETPAPAAEEIPPLSAADLTIPEGIEVPEETMKEFLSLMNDRDLAPKDRASKLLALQSSFLTQVSQSVMDEMTTVWNETQAAWKADIRKLPEIGGANTERTLAQINRGIELSGGDKETFDALSLTGAGSHPAIVKLLYNLTKHLAEPAPVGGQPARTPLSQADALYPTMAKKE